MHFPLHHSQYKNSQQKKRKEFEEKKLATWHLPRGWYWLHGCTVARLHVLFNIVEVFTLHESMPIERVQLET